MRKMGANRSVVISVKAAGVVWIMRLSLRIRAEAVISNDIEAAFVAHAWTVLIAEREARPNINGVSISIDTIADACPTLAQHGGIDIRVCIISRIWRDKRFAIQIKASANGRHARRKIM
jgi:hypothetical protein